MSDTSSQTRRPSGGCLAHLKSGALTVFRHAKSHTGVGIVCAVAYFDPGNWGVDLQAGSQFGYKLLFVVLLAGLFAIVLQVLACRLGCVTGLGLAAQCRLLLHSRSNHPRVYRYLLLYPLYVLSEVAIIATDLAELLGSAIALCMLFPTLPLWAGVLLTAADVLVLLALGDPLRGRPVKAFEFTIALLVLAVLICIAIVVAKVDVDWGNAFHGYIPSREIFAHGGLYTSVGIIGATVMPHSLFLGSHLATQDRISSAPPKPDPSAADVEFKPRAQSFVQAVKTWTVASVRSALHAPPSIGPQARNHAEHDNNALGFVRAHLYHGMADMVLSLLGFAVVINSLILVLASAVFFYGAVDGRGAVAPATLFDAHDLIRDVVGKAAATLFALALLAAGQSSSIIATLAGQNVSEGFLQWHVSPVVRRLATRLIGLVPAMVVALAIGRAGISALLVISQVVLSVVLPFVTLPLIYLTASRRVMSVRADGPRAHLVASRDVEEGGGGGEGWVDYSSGWLLTGVGGVIWLVIVVANVYVLVALALGEGS
ncbi:hypothetical protein PLICRDRAFT_49119 [Plicaturopsis crispa FD-325 SS-3]|nr:hypothetical protein PLICRDRAFT_49119 [Plicaturopsis crispa FD-325 SS-3]